MKARLIEILKERSVRTGTFTLASGKTSDLYVDARQTTLSPEGSTVIAKMILERLHPDVVGVGGPVTGADPMTGAIVTHSFLDGRPLHGFMVRKEPKGHGMQRYIEGPVEKGNRVVIVEDVTTTGGSSLLAIDRAVEFGLKVERVITVVDRLAGAAEAFAARGIPLEPLVTIRDLGIEPE
jgi:orotate phosphoribosyltransferase